MALASVREDIGNTEQKFKTVYLNEKYSIEDLEGKFSQMRGFDAPGFYEKTIVDQRMRT